MVASHTPHREAEKAFVWGNTQNVDPQLLNPLGFYPRISIYEGGFIHGYPRQTT
jgi:hypothetical protein